MCESGGRDRAGGRALHDTGAEGADGGGLERGRDARSDAAVDDARQAPRHHHAPAAAQRRDQPSARHGPARGLLPAGGERPLHTHGVAARRARQVRRAPLHLRPQQLISS